MYAREPRCQRADVRQGRVGLRRGAREKWHQVHRKAEDIGAEPTAASCRDDLTRLAALYAGL